MKQIQIKLTILIVVLFVTMISQGTFSQESNLQIAQSLGARNDSDAIIRLNRAEEQIRNLTGQIEEMYHQIRQLQDRIRRMQEDSEYRFRELENGTGINTDGGIGVGAGAGRSAGTAGSGGVISSNQDSTAGIEPNSPNLSGQNLQNLPNTDSSTGILGQLNNDSNVGAGAGSGAVVDNSNEPLDLIPFPNNPITSDEILPQDQFGLNTENSPQIGGNFNPSGQPTYDEAYSNLLTGNYETAAQLFTQFLEEFPDDPLAVDAQFWLGESYFARQMYKEATDAFLKSYTDYPTSNKASESLLKMGISLNGMGEQELACSTLAELFNKFPNAPSSVQNRAKAEYDRVECT